MTRRLSGTLVVCATALVVALPAAASATTPATGARPVVPGSGYLALGDSVTFGYQEAQVAP